MKIKFIGVGEAFDQKYGNTSFVLTSNDTNILVDCGYQIPERFWNSYEDGNFLDAIYISHLHFDHYFGLPILLKRMKYVDKRTKSLTIISEKGNKQKIYDLIKLANGGNSFEFPFELNFVEVEDGSDYKFRDIKLSFAKTDHFISNLVVKFDDLNRLVCYSGDGEITENSMQIYKNSDVLIQESFFMKDGLLPGHGSIENTINVAKEVGIKKLILTHLQYDFREKKLDAIKEFINNQDIEILIPKVGEEIYI